VRYQETCAPAQSGRPVAGFDSPSGSRRDPFDLDDCDEAQGQGVAVEERPPPPADPCTTPSEADRLEADSPVLDLEVHSWLFVMKLGCRPATRAVKVR
jgi:hypothetical protein